MRLKIGAGTFNVKPSARLFAAWFRWWLIPDYKNLTTLAAIITESKLPVSPMPRARVVKT